MSKQIALLLVGLVAFCAAQVQTAIVPPIGLAAGSEYQLIFVTSGTTNGQSPDISNYNAFVNVQAALSPSLPIATWSAVGSTDTVNANVNAPSDFVGGSYLPVYNTQGLLVTAAGLYSDIIPVNAITYTQMGVPTATAVWTGSSAFGAAEPGAALGAGQVQVGISNDAGNPGWLSETAFNPAGDFPLYALSSVLVATPEPASIVLLALGAAGLFFAARRR
jgi:hypothetical protein